ncbi:MAG: CaiB/BaiF CoA transferase family protein [Candidatus Helarchaeota archaeon]
MNGNKMSVLNNIRILDLTMLVPGPYATRILGDLGAEIIKIESPNRVDIIRNRDPLLNKPNEEKYGSYHANLNRNKKSLTLNLKTEQGRRIFYELSKRSDVIIESFRPNVKKRLKIDYETIKKLNPKIIYCSLTGFGQTGPYSNRPGHDLNYVSLSGMLFLSSQPNSSPLIPNVQVADFGGAMSAVIAILSALIARNKHQIGQYLDIALMDVTFSWLTGIFSSYFLTGEKPIPSKGRLNGGHPGYNIYKTKDGKFVALCALEEKFWKNLLIHLDKPEYSSQKILEKKRNEIKFFLTSKFLEKNRDEWISELESVETCITPVLEINEVIDHPQVKNREIFQEYIHPNFGKQIQVSSPIKLSKTPLQINRKAPFLGENNDDILSELGYNEEEIKNFKENGIV